MYLEKAVSGCSSIYLAPVDVESKEGTIRNEMWRGLDWWLSIRSSLSELLPTAIYF